LRVVLIGGWLDGGVGRQRIRGVMVGVSCL
jgi:hypothetical protein